MREEMYQMPKSETWLLVLVKWFVLKNTTHLSCSCCGSEYLFFLVYFQTSLIFSRKNQSKVEIFKRWFWSLNFLPLLAQHSDATTCFDQYSACLLVHKNMRSLSRVARVANCLNAMNSEIPELKGFAWNYSTDRYWIVSNNRGYLTNASKKIFDNLAPVIFAGNIMKEIWVSKNEWTHPLSPTKLGPRLYLKIYSGTEWKEKINFTKHV